MMKKSILSGLFVTIVGGLIVAWLQNPKFVSSLFGYLDTLNSNNKTEKTSQSSDFFLDTRWKVNDGKLDNFFIEFTSAFSKQRKLYMMCNITPSRGIIIELCIWRTRNKTLAFDLSYFYGEKIGNGQILVPHDSYDAGIEMHNVHYTGILDGISLSGKAFEAATNQEWKWNAEKY